MMVELEELGRSEKLFAELFGADKGLFCLLCDCGIQGVTRL